MLSFLAPHASEHTPRCMTADVAARARAPHAWAIGRTDAEESSVEHSRARGQTTTGFQVANRSAQTCCIQTSSPSTFATSSRLRPQYSEIWAFFHRQPRRSYSTADDDYLVEEDEENAILAAPSGLPALGTEQLMQLMNPEFRALRRFAYLVNTQDHQFAPGMQALLERAGTFPLLDEFLQQDAWWIKKFAYINALYDVRLPLELRTSQLEVNASTEQAVKLLFSRGRGVPAIRQTWIDLMREHYSYEGKRNVWCEMMLWLLHHDHDAVLPTLEAIGRGSKAPTYVVADILEHFMSNHLQHTEPGQGTLPSRFIPTLLLLLEQKPYLARALSQKFLHLTLIHSSLQEGTTIWNRLRAHGFRPSWFTYYHIAYFFGRHGEYEMALEILQKPIALGAPPTHWAFMSTCAQVLRSSVTKADAYHASSRVLSKFIEMGISLNVPLYTVLMHNAVDHGDVQAALNMFDIMQSKGIEPNDYTYTVLLKLLKGGDDPNAFRAIVRQAGQALPTLQRPRVVATDLVHCIYLMRFEPARSDHAFADLAQTYHEYFDPSPLVRLGVPAQYFGNPNAPIRMGMTPGPPAIGILFTAYLELISRNNPEVVVHLYRIFRHRIDDVSDTVISELREVNYFYNAFLLAMGQNASTLHLMPEVLRQMTDKRIHREPLTTVHTWDILINAFMRHNQPEAAARVKQAMGTYGQEPNEVAWNSLVKGYARLQDVDGVLNTIRDMQLRKFVLGDDSLRLMGRIKEGDRLRKGLRDVDAMKRRQEAEEQDYLVPDDYQVSDDYQEDPSDKQKIGEEIREEIEKEEEEEGDRRPTDTDKSSR